MPRYARVLPIASTFVVVGAATALMLCVRFLLIEPEALAVACALHDEGWRCGLRDAFVFGFLHNAFGWTSLLTGAFALVTRWRWLALLAMLAGVAGAVLYTFELSGVGLLLGALVFAQRTPMPDQERRHVGEA